MPITLGESLYPCIDTPFWKVIITPCLFVLALAGTSATSVLQDSVMVSQRVSF